MAEGDFTGGSTDVLVTAGPRAQAGARAGLALVVTIGSQAGAKSTAAVVTAGRGGFGSNTWAGVSTAAVLTGTRPAKGVVDLTGALGYATDVAATAPSAAGLVTALTGFIDAVKAAGAAIRVTGGDHVQAGVRDENGDPIPTRNGWIGRAVDIHRTGVVHGDEGVQGFCLAGVDYVAWMYEGLVSTDSTPHRGIRVGGS